jgi:hypothetical protein
MKLMALPQKYFAVSVKSISDKPERKGENTPKNTSALLN